METPGALLHAFSAPATPQSPSSTRSPIRDGGSLDRRVVAIQHGQAIFHGRLFHNEEGGLHHQIKMPDVLSPEALPSEAELMSG